MHATNPSVYPLGVSADSPASIRLLVWHLMTVRRLQEIGAPVGETMLVRAMGGLDAVRAEIRERECTVVAEVQ
jgi:hypothetical protein